MIKSRNSIPLAQRINWSELEDVKDNSAKKIEKMKNRLMLFIKTTLFLWMIAFISFLHSASLAKTGYSFMDAKYYYITTILLIITACVSQTHTTRVCGKFKKLKESNQ